jgi:ribosome-associated protein
MNAKDAVGTRQASSTKAPAKKTVAKKPAAKTAVKKSAAAKKTVAPKKSATKPAAKKTVGTKSAAVGTRHASSTASGAKSIAKKPAAPKAAPKKAAAPAPVKGLKGIQGGKAARIAQIVAESFLPVGTTHASSPATPVAADETVRVAHRIATELFAKKAEDVVLMDLRNLSTVADYYLIATCRNEPQMRAILGGVQRALSREGVRSLRSEYMPGVRWAVVDFGDIILHLFEKQTRGFYSLERLWADAPSTTLRAEDYVSEDAAADEDDAGRTSAHDDL